MQPSAQSVGLPKHDRVEQLSRMQGSVSTEKVNQGKKDTMQPTALSVDLLKQDCVEHQSKMQGRVVKTCVHGDMLMCIRQSDLLLRACMKGAQR